MTEQHQLNPNIRSPERSRFLKAHCLGNTYIVFDACNIGFPVSSGNIQSICDLRRGLGSDGILLHVESPGPAFGVRIFNPDGTEAETSGNGLRIFAYYLFTTGQTKDTHFEISTKGGISHVALDLDSNQDVRTAAISMGQATFVPAALPCTLPAEELLLQPIEVAGSSLLFSGVSLGNPHCVLFAQHNKRWTRQELFTLGPALENHPIFPNRVNVQLASVEGPDTLDILIWERGAGETEASGSSACAAAAAAVRLGIVKSPVTVQAPGGTQYVTVDASFRLVLTGPVTAIAFGSLSSQYIADLNSNVASNCQR